MKKICFYSRGMSDYLLEVPQQKEFDLPWLEYEMLLIQNATNDWTKS